MIRIASSIIITAFLASSTLGFDPPSQGSLLMEENFTADELPKLWTVQNGNWDSKEGALVGTEIEADHHAAAARRVLETTHAVYQFRFRISEGTKGFHFGFDPARGELDKKGHLFSVIVTPRDWRIMKHLDKNKPKEDPNEILKLSKQAFEPGKWYDLRVTTTGTKVEAEIKGLEPLHAEHPSFGVKKPTLVFRVAGSEVAVDDLKVWALGE